MGLLSELCSLGHKHSAPKFPHLWKGGNNSNLTELFWELNEVIQIYFLALVSARSITIFTILKPDSSLSCSSFSVCKIRRDRKVWSTEPCSSNQKPWVRVTVFAIFSLWLWQISYPFQLQVIKINMMIIALCLIGWLQKSHSTGYIQKHFEICPTGARTEILQEVNLSVLIKYLQGSQTTFFKLFFTATH